MANFGRVRILVWISVLLVVFMTSWGCARLQNDTKSSEQLEPDATTGDITPSPLYYDFEDILLPAELKVNKKKSFVHHATDFRAGVLVLTGHVEINSLVRFFEINMVKDNWRLVTSFRSPRTMMFFEKSNRDCIISVTEKPFKLEVEIWVAPNTRSAEEDLLK